MYGPHGDPRKQARDADERHAAQSRQLAMTHHMSPEQIEAMYEPIRKRLDAFDPSLGGMEGLEKKWGPLLPPGASFSPGAGDGWRESYRKSAGAGRRGSSPSWNSKTANGVGGYGVGSGSMFSSPAPFLPEFASPDRLNYPVQRVLANNYWRLYYKLDPDLGPGIDILSELPFGKFELTGAGVDGEVRDLCMLAVEECKLGSVMPSIVRETHVLGEAGIHQVWDDDSGIWTHVGFLNPDQLEVTGMPLVKHDPIVRYKPDFHLREVLNSDLHQAQALRDSLPDEVLDMILGGRPIEMSPVSFTFLARKQHPYDIRGTSALTRAWRALMLEDAVYNADIQVSRRNAAPIRLVKLGDPATGWVPGPEQAMKFQQMLTQAESDPLAVLTWSYAVQFELIGTQERSVKASQYADLLQRLKLSALGINKSILNSETAYAAAVTGLTIFLQKLQSIRQWVESEWLIPKFFRQMSEMNMWIRPTEAELSHGVRTRRGYHDLADRNRYIVPKIEWERKLDPSVESAQIQALNSLHQMGVRFSQQTMMSFVNRSYESEMQQMAREATLRAKILQQSPQLAQALAGPAEGGGGGGGGGGGILPGIPPEAMGFDAPLDEGAPPPEGAPPGEAPPPDAGPAPASAQAAPEAGPAKADDQPKPDGRGDSTKLGPSAVVGPPSTPSTGGWTEEQLLAFGALAEGQLDQAAKLSPMLAQFLRMDGTKLALQSRDPFVLLNALDSYMISMGYPQDAIQAAVTRVMRMTRPSGATPSAAGAASPPQPAPGAEPQPSVNAEISARISEMMDQLDRDDPHAWTRPKK